MVFSLHQGKGEYANIVLGLKRLSKTILLIDVGLACHAEAGLLEASRVCGVGLES